MIVPCIHAFLNLVGSWFVVVFSHTLIHWFSLTNWPIWLEFSMICYKTIFKTPYHVGNVWKMQAVRCSSAQTFYVASSCSCTYMLKICKIVQNVHLIWWRINSRVDWIVPKSLFHAVSMGSLFGVIRFFCLTAYNQITIWNDWGHHFFNTIHKMNEWCVVRWRKTPRELLSSGSALMEIFHRGCSSRTNYIQAVSLHSFVRQHFRLHESIYIWEPKKKNIYIYISQSMSKRIPHMPGSGKVWSTHDPWAIPSDKAVALFVMPMWSALNSGTALLVHSEEICFLF